MVSAVRTWVLGVCVMLAMLAASAAEARERKVLVMGDSLSAAYGLRPEQGWVALALLWWGWLLVCSTPLPLAGFGVAGWDKGFVQALVVIRLLVFAAAGICAARKKPA